MTTNSFLAYIFACAIICMIMAGASRVLRWRKGTAAPTRLFHGLLQIPWRYLVKVHHVVARKEAAARMHASLAGGFLLVAFAAVLVVFAGLSGPLGWGLFFISSTTFIVGMIHLGYRRLHQTPELSKGAFDRFPISLGIVGLLFIFEMAVSLGAVAPIDWVAYWPLVVLAGAAVADLSIGVALGPMRHAFAGALHLAWHPRQGRFDEKSTDTAPQLIDLTQSKLGAETLADFPWNRLLGFDACVQCGRCEEACPAFAAELPLNPKKLIQDLVNGGDVGWLRQRYTGSLHPGKDAQAPEEAGFDVRLVGTAAAIHPDTLWACTTCRACVQECPMFIEHVDSIIDLRRFQTLELGQTIGKVADTLRNLRHTHTEEGAALSKRHNWATDLQIDRINTERHVDILLWVGEAGFDLRNNRSLRALVRILKAAKLNFAILDEEERDCGDTARRLGDEALFQELAKTNIDTLSTYSFNRIVTMDPHILHCLSREYPALGGNYTVLHHTTLIADLIESGDLRFGKASVQLLTYHDPCYLGRYMGEFSAPRRILDVIGAKPVEMARSGPSSMCCGGGGGAPLADVEGKRRIPDIRMEQIKETGARSVVVACPNCTKMLEGVTAPRPAVLEIAEILADLLPKENMA